MHAVELTVEVTHAVGLPGPLLTAATVVLPDPTTIGDLSVVCFAFPGGGYNRRYFTLDLAAEDGVGQAAWHTARGWIFVACDHLGVGDSTVLDPDPLTYEIVAAANRATVLAVLARLAEGTLSPGFPAVTDPVTLGLGQSMGGCFTIVAQAHHQVFDGVGILGFSAIHTQPPSPPGQATVPMPWIPRNSSLAAPTILNPAALASGSEPIARVSDLAAAVKSGGEGDEHIWTWAFHHDDERREIVTRDMAAMAGGEIPPWRSATTPACALFMVAPGTVATEAAAITVPVLVAVGERDVVADPWMEPKAFRSCTDVTVFVCSRMAHMHNFAPTRQRLWSRIHSWGEGVAALVQR